jgi:predicted MFS family arabinose efflux permease
MVCAMLVFIGHFAFFTYLRPFLEFTTGAGIAMISSVLLGFGVASRFGALLAGFMLERPAPFPTKLRVEGVCSSRRSKSPL